MDATPNCPECDCDYAYLDRDQFVCPQCAHEWTQRGESADNYQVCDANGNPLQTGDSVSVIRDLKVKGASSIIKVGTKVKAIRVLEPDFVVDGHDIDCKIDGFGAIKLKSSVVKKN